VSGILNKEKCSVVSETSYVIRGQTFAVRVYYGFAEGKKGTVSILLPENMTLKYVCSESFCQGGAWIFFILLTQILSLLLPE